jgi:hypothetical protein
MNPDVAFNQMIVRFGYELTDRFSEEVRAVLARQRAEWQESINRTCEKSSFSSPRSIFYGHTGNSTFNACAFEAEEGHPCIAVNFGVYTSLQTAFARILAQPEVLPNVGSSLSERPDLPKFNIFENDLNNLGGDPTGKSFAAIRPIDPARGWLLGILTSMAFRFLVGHEFAHLAKGHIGFLNESTGSPFIAEMDAKKTSLDAYKTHVLEMDADYSALSWVLGMALRHTEIERRDRIPESIRPLYEDPLFPLFTAMFAIYIVFRFFELRHTDLDNLASGSHPAAILRLGFLVDRLGKWMETHCSNFAEHAFHILQTAIEVAETAIPLVSDSVPRFDLRDIFAIVNDSRSLRYLDEIVEADQVLRPQFEKHDWYGDHSSTREQSFSFADGSSVEVASPFAGISSMLASIHRTPNAPGILNSLSSHPNSG